jgi:DNA-binding transcriptional ArsR family regulator
MLIYIDMSNDIYSAIGNQVRAKLLLCLAKKPKTVTELIGNCDLSQSAVSQHLLKLKQSGLISATKKGQFVTYSLKYTQAARICYLLNKLSQEASP